MTGNRLSTRPYIVPTAAYVLVIFIIALMTRFLSSDFVLPLAALLMFGMPFVMKSGVKGLRWNLRGVLIGVVLSVVILSLYVLLCVAAFDKPVRLDNVSYLVIIQHLLLVSVPEEVFFRGYLQEEMGNNLKGILVVSLLFAVGHLAVRCFGRMGRYMDGQSIRHDHLWLGSNYMRRARAFFHGLFIFLFSNLVLDLYAPYFVHRDIGIFLDEPAPFCSHYVSYVHCYLPNRQTGRS